MHLYPDVYNRGGNTLENLRVELTGSGIDTAKLDEQTLKQMLKRVSKKEG